MGLKLVLLVTVTNHTEAPVWSTNHMSGLISRSCFYRCMLPRLQPPFKTYFVDERRETGKVGLV